MRTELHQCYYANVFYLGRFLCHCYALLCFACLLVLIHDSSMSPVCGYSNQAAGSCYYNDRQSDPNQSGRRRRTNKVTRSSDNTTRSSKVSKYLAPGAIRSGSKLFPTHATRRSPRPGFNSDGSRLVALRGLSSRLGLGWKVYISSPTGQKRLTHSTYSKRNTFR